MIGPSRATRWRISGCDRIGQQFEHLRGDRRLEIGDQHRGDLRMLLVDQPGDLARVEPVEQVDLARVLGGNDPREHAVGLFASQGAGHHRFDLGPRIEADRGPLARLADEIVEHEFDLGLADIGDGEHRLAELADLVGIELLEDGGSLLLADQHHQHGGAFDAGIGVERAAVLMMLVGEEEAAAILQKLDPDEVRELGKAMFAVADVSETEVEFVLDDFVGKARERTAIGFDPRPQVEAVMTRALGREKADSVLARIIPAEDACQIDLLDWLDAGEIAGLIDKEHPQIAAVLIANDSTPRSPRRCSNCCPTRSSPISSTALRVWDRSRPRRSRR